MAMLLAERDALEASELYGSDCRQDAIRAAQTGRYQDLDVRHLPKSLLQKYFHRDQNVVSIVAPIKARTRWAVADATATSDIAAWDLLLCRNLAIYLTPLAARNMWVALEKALRPGGVLVVGKAEKPIGTALVRIAQSIYRKK